MLHSDAADVVVAIGPQSFYLPACKTCAEVIIKLRKDGLAPDINLMVNGLREADKLETVGGPEALVRLLANAPSHESAITYRERLSELARQRSALFAAHGLIDAVMKGETPDRHFRSLEEAVNGRRSTDSAALLRLRESLHVADEIDNLLPPTPLLGGLLMLDTIAVLYGPPGSAKSFVAIDWALSVATGSWWFGRSVEKGRVLYVAPEGAAGISSRVKAWKQARNTWSIDAMRWLTTSANLMIKEEAEALRTISTEIAPSLIVLDTLARSMTGGDENSSRDMGIVIEEADRLRETSGACVLLVHHSGKDNTAGSRGSTALPGAVETEIQCSRSEENEVTLKLKKQKNGKDGMSIPLQLITEGESCVIGKRKHQEQSDQLSPGALSMLKSLTEIVTEHGSTTSAWRDQCDTSMVTVRTFQRWSKRMLELKIITNIGTAPRPRYVLTAAGEEMMRTSSSVPSDEFEPEPSTPNGSKSATIHELF